MDRKQRDFVEMANARPFCKQLTHRALRIVIDSNVGQLHRIAEMQPVIVAQHEFLHRGIITLINKQRLAGLAAQRGQIELVANCAAAVDTAAHQHMLPDSGCVRRTWRLGIMKPLQCTALPMRAIDHPIALTCIR